MTGRPERKRGSGASRGKARAARNAAGTAQINLAKALAAVFSAGVYTKEDLQAAVCTFVSEMKQGGETGEGVVRAAQSLVRDVGARFPSSARTQVLLADMVTWCLAEYYRESA
jgi:hexokinase